MNTTPLGMGRTAQNRVDGYQVGLSRTGNHHALSAVAYGSNLQVGRLVVYAPTYNQAVAAGDDNPMRVVMQPTEDGAGFINPVDGSALDAAANAALVTAMKVGVAPNDVFRVAGVVIEGDKCDGGYCDEPSLWPIGEPNNLHELNYIQHRRPATVCTHGYLRVFIAEDLAVGQRLSFSSTVDNADPTVGVRSHGYFLAAGNGDQDLPEDWYVVTGGKAGETAEIFISGLGA